MVQRTCGIESEISSKILCLQKTLSAKVTCSASLGKNLCMIWFFVGIEKGGKFGFASRSGAARFAAWDIGNAQGAGRTKFSKALKWLGQAVVL